MEQPEQRKETENIEVVHVEPDGGTWLSTASMLALGASTLSPWLAYIAAADFFLATYPNDQLMFFIPVQNFSVLFFGGVLMMAYGEKVSLNSRIVYPQLLLVCSLCVVPSLNYLNVPQHTALISTLVAQFIGAACVTIFQTSSYGAGGLLGPTFTNALEAGKGIGGLGIILARMVAKAMLPDTPAGLKASTNAFFIFSNVLVVISLVFWFLLLDTPFARQKFGAYEAQRRAAILYTQLEKRDLERGSSLNERSHLLPNNHSHVGMVAYMRVLKAVAVPAAVVCATFVVCLGCFPGLTTSLQSNNLNLGDWFPVLLVFAYNTFDLVGKSLPSVIRLLCVKTLPIAVAVHLLFVPIFVYLATGPGGFFGLDEVAFLIVSLLGLCTGYITCTSMMLGPSTVLEDDRVLAGQMMSTFLIFGLFAGSMLGVALSWVSKDISSHV